MSAIAERIVDTNTGGKPIVNNPRIPPVSAIPHSFLFNASIPPRIVKTASIHSIVAHMIRLSLILSGVIVGSNS